MIIPWQQNIYVTTEVKDAKDNIIVPAGKVVASNYQVSYYNGRQLLLQLL